MASSNLMNKLSGLAWLCHGGLQAITKFSETAHLSFRNFPWPFHSAGTPTGILNTESSIKETDDQKELSRD